MMYAMAVYKDGVWWADVSSRAEDRLCCDFVVDGVPWDNVLSVWGFSERGVRRKAKRALAAHERYREKCEALWAAKRNLEVVS